MSKKGMSHVPFNGRSQQTPSARFGKEKIACSAATTRFPRARVLFQNMGAHVRCTSAKKLVSSDFAKILEVATKIRETCEKTLFTPSSPVKATKLYRFCLSDKSSPKSPINV